MAKPFDTDLVEKWRGYFSELGSIAERAPITEDLIRAQIAVCVGELVSPANAAIKATIAAIRDKGIALELPGGKLHLCSYREIIDAEKVIRHWLARGMTPEVADFREPDAEIGVGPIANNSYAPALAERVRRLVQSTPRQSLEQAEGG
jgi:hypothetical protein